MQKNSKWGSTICTDEHFQPPNQKYYARKEQGEAVIFWANHLLHNIPSNITKTLIVRKVMKNMKVKEKRKEEQKIKKIVCPSKLHYVN